MKKQVIISYNWNCNDELPEGNAIPKRFHTALEEDAMDRIQNQMADGIREGELHTNINLPDNDDEAFPDGVSFSGWFTIKKEAL